MKHETIFNNLGGVFLTIPLKNKMWSPIIDKGFTLEEAKTKATDLIKILSKGINGVYPQPSISRCQIALRLFLIANDETLTDKQKKKELDKLRF
jgi:hypothetical protein